MTEEDTIKKLETIKVSGDKDYIYNFEAGIILNLIQKQQEEIEKKDKIIGKMIDNIMIHYQVKTIRKMCCPACKIGERACTYSGIHRDCIKRYFERKAEV